MAFKGVFDGSVEIGQAREARDVQMEMQQRQIAAQIAMQQQQIAAQMSMQQQQLRASTADRQSALSANTAQANADRAQKQQQFQSGVSIDQQKIGLGQQAQTLEQRKFDSGQELQTLQQTNAKLLLQKSQQDFEDDQAQRASQTAFQQSAFGAVLMTAMLNTAAPVASISRFNAAMGIPDGAEGSMTTAYFDRTGGHYTMIGRDAKGNLGKVEHEVDPGATIKLGHSLYGAKDAVLLFQQYRQNNMDNTKMTLATDSYLKAMDIQAAKDATAAAKRDADAAKFNPALDKARAAEVDRQTALAADSKTLSDDAATARATAAKITGVRRKDLRIDTPSAQSPNGGASGAWDATAPTQPSAGQTDYGMRNDGVTKKGKGWLGELKLPDGSVATEYTIGVQMDGKETDIPSLVPTLTKSEVAAMVNDIIPNDKPVPKVIAQKAVDFAKAQKAAGKGFFVDNNSPVAGATKGAGQPATPQPTAEKLGNGEIKFRTPDGKWWKKPDTPELRKGLADLGITITE